MTLQERWDQIQAFLDIDGDVWMGLLTAIYCFRIIGVVFHYPPVTMAEAGIYGTAVTAFAYSNKK